MTENSNKSRTAALHNLGCKVNAYETEAMRKQLEDAGFRIVPFDEKADVYVINTCSVTAIADKKSRQMLRRAREKNPGALVAAAGCFVQTAGENALPAGTVDIYIGNDHKHELSAVIEEYMQKGKDNAPVSRISDLSRSCEYENMPPVIPGEHTRAFIKIQDGCDQFCSYCIIPYARGRIRSRSESDVIEEIRTLAANCINETVLTGIHISSYGKDMGKEDALAALVERISRETGIRRIRLGSLEPGIITGEFAERLSSVKEVCPHFHLSMQSGSNTVLKRMNRKYTADEYAEKCGILRDVFDRPAITTDVITGFPGETDDEFEETFSLLERLKLYETHIFRYSVREGTRAAAMPGQIASGIKAKRSDRLIRLGEKNKALFEKSLEGSEDELLIEEMTEEGGIRWYTGFTRRYIRCLVKADDCPGEIRPGELIRGRIGEERPSQDIDAVLFVPTKY